MKKEMKNGKNLVNGNQNNKRGDFLINLELEKLIRKIATEIDERIKNFDFKVKNITFDKKDDEILKIRITKK